MLQGKTYPDLSDIVITDYVTKNNLPSHVELGAWDYTKVKTKQRATVRQPGEPSSEWSG